MTNANTLIYDRNITDYKRGTFIGNLDYAGLIAKPSACYPWNTTDHFYITEKFIPIRSFITFQMMFANIAPVLLTGTFAERIKFRHYIAFIVLWELIVYYPIAHLILHDNGWLKKSGTLDFAGGITIHFMPGVTAFFASIWIPKRKTKLDSSHNLPLACIGASLLWMGWYGFNAGSAMITPSKASLALMNTHTSPIFSFFIWMVGGYFFERKISIIYGFNGAIAGLAAITSGSGFVEDWATIIISCVSGVISLTVYISRRYIINFLSKTYYFSDIFDDTLDVFAIHGVSGFIGTMFVGLFATTNVNKGLQLQGSFYDISSPLIGIQLFALLITCIWTSFFTNIIFLIIRLSFCWESMNDPQAEIGLDITQHREEAYNDERIDETELLIY